MKSYREILTDGGSRVAEQVLEQKLKIKKNLSSIRHLVAIGSGKGGVGKSTVTMQVAASLGSMGEKVSVLDADLNGPSLARFSGVGSAVFVPSGNGFSVPKTKGGIGVVSFGTIVPEPEAVSFESVSSGESYVWRSTKEFSVLGEILSGANWGELDYLLIDLPPGAERTFQFAEFLGPRAKFVLVTIPSDMSIGVVRRGLSALKKTQNEVLGLIENMSGYFCPECKKEKPLFPSSKKIDLGIPCLGRIPFDPKLAEACDRGIPLTDCHSRSSFEPLREISIRLREILLNLGGHPT